VLTELVPGVAVATAELYTTTSTVVSGADGGCLLIDPAVTVADLAGLAAALADLRLTPRAGFSTHPHWDHVLWSRELGGDVPRYAAPAAASAARAGRDALFEQAEREDPGHDRDLLGRLVALEADAIAWQGPQARVITHNGHELGHSAVFLPDSGVLVAGDMLSDIEMPLLDTDSAGAVGDYRAGLTLLAGVEGVSWVIPGHGHVGDAAEFRRRLDADRRYLERLVAGRPFTDPRIAQGPQWLRAAHDRQVEHVARHAGPL
jgi:hydroxyacylglutathione hydrolase